jgi:hypothetical protein
MNNLILSPGQVREELSSQNKSIRLYYHKTSGGAEYLFDTFIKCQNGHKEGAITPETKYIVRIDGDIRKDAELTIK